MYLNHYKLKLMPFEIGPDPKFLWLGSKHKEAFAALRYGILESKGFIVTIGDPGTGKSTLLNALAANFESNIRFAKITDPALNEMDFFNFVANAFEMGKTFKNKSEFLIEFSRFVKEAGAQSKKVILVIDEAQRLTAQMLEQIRVFSNVETPGQKVVSCIFAGQTEFLDMVKQNRALTQRVFFSHIIQPLTQSETGEYIAHRLKIAGTEEPIFTSTAIQEIFRLTGGIPRLINILCDQALLGGYALNQQMIGPQLIAESTENTLISLKTDKEPAADGHRQGPSKQLAATEPTAESTTERSRSAPPKTELTTPARKTSYWVPIALIGLLGLIAYLYLNDEFRVAIKGYLTDSGQVKSEVQSAGSMPGAGDIGQLQNQMLGLRKQKDDAEAHLEELQTRTGALEKDKQELKAAITELEKKLASGGPAQNLLKGEADTLKKEIPRLQAQLAEVSNQKGAVEARLGEVEKQNTGLATETKELKSARDRAAQLETTVSERDKKLIQLEQKFGELEKTLATEKAAKDKMADELSSRQTIIADLQKQHEAGKSSQLKLETDLQNSQRENARLQAQQAEINKQNTGLATETKELKSVRDRAAQLETTVSERDKKLIQLEQKFGEQEKTLAMEKAAKDKMAVELSSRQTIIADLQKRYETAKSSQLKLETDMQNSQRENIRLQSQVQEVKAEKKPALPSAPAAARTPVSSQSPPVSTDTGKAAHDPAGVIDFVIKRKAQ